MEEFIQRIEPEIGRLIRDQRWFNRNQDIIAEVKIYDYLRLEDNEASQVVLLIVRVSFGHEVKFYFVPVEVGRLSNGDVAPNSTVFLWGEHQWQINELSYSQVFNRAMVRLIVGEVERVPTHNGNCLIFERNPLKTTQLEAVDECIPFEVNKSSNCLTYIEAGGGKYIHKTYKSLDSNNHEIFLFKKILDLEGGTPAVIGNYFYQDLKNEISFPLGMILEFLEGESIDKDLNRNIRSLWNEPALFETAGEAQDSIIWEHIKPLKLILEGVATRLCRFHQSINSILKPEQNIEPFCLNKYLRCCRSRLERVAGFVDQDRREGRKELSWISQSLMKYRDTVFAESQCHEPFAFLPGFCHGDLHLSNLLYRYQDGNYQDVKIIDFAPRCIDSHSEQFFTQSPLQDVIAIQRGLEYFSFDEASREIAKQLDISEQLTFEYQFLSVLPNFTDLHSTLSLTAIENLVKVRTINEIARRWNELIFEIIWDNYFKDHMIDQYYSKTQATQTIAAMRNIFYLSRLLKELEYNYDYHRDCFKNVDFYYLGLFHDRVNREMSYDQTFQEK